MSIADTVRANVNAVRGAVDRPTPARVCRDMDLLVPAFRSRVESVLADMRAQGFDPLVWETWRSRERAALLSARGVGVVQSMHCYGCAVDIISESKRWGAPRKFWLALGAAAKAHGLTWGGTWRRHDLPHLQAVPIGPLQQLVRASTPDEIADLVTRRLHTAHA